MNGAGRFREEIDEGPHSRECANNDMQSHL